VDYHGTVGIGERPTLLGDDVFDIRHGAGSTPAPRHLPPDTAEGAIRAGRWSKAARQQVRGWSMPRDGLDGAYKPGKIRTPA
jgi:hypothetical protein